MYSEEDLKVWLQNRPCAQYLVAAGGESLLLCSASVPHDRALGTLTVARCNEEPFSAKEIELLNEVAKQIAIAVENAQAYQGDHRTER